jgi:hypothetical protein
MMVGTDPIVAPDKAAGCLYRQWDSPELRAPALAYGASSGQGISLVTQ